MNYETSLKINLASISILHIIYFFVIILAIISNNEVLKFFFAAFTLFMFTRSLFTFFILKTSLRKMIHFNTDQSEFNLDSNAIQPPVTLISVARNEEENIEVSVRSFLNLNYNNLEIVIVNDHSTDQTRNILDKLKLEYPKLKIIHNPPRKQNWLGKANGIWHAVLETNTNTRWLLFADADVVLHPNSLSQAIFHTEKSRADFFSSLPFLINKTLVEKLVINNYWKPNIFWHYFNHPYGIGAFLLVKRNLYLQSGGHSKIASMQPEDCLLSSLLKAFGSRMIFAWTSNAVAVRLYSGWNQINRATTKKRIVLGQRNIYQLTEYITSTITEELLPILMSALYTIKLLNSFNLLNLSLLISFISFYCLQNITLLWLKKLSNNSFTSVLLHPLGSILKLYIAIKALLKILFRVNLNLDGRFIENKI